MAEKAMGSERLIFSASTPFRVLLHWRDDYGSDGPIGRTWGDLELWVGDTLVWGQSLDLGHTSGVTWNWIELLEFLGNAWPYLIEQEDYPIAFDTRWEEPAHLGELWGKAKLRFMRLSAEQAEQEDARLRDFLLVHDLAEALQGAHAPKLLLLRRGNQMLAATVRQEWSLPFDTTLSVLESIGNAISDRLTGLTDKRSRTARELWQKRDSMPTIERLKLATGINEATLKLVWPWDLDSEPANDKLYQLKALARMIGPRANDEHLKTFLKSVDSLPQGKPLRLGAISQKALEIIREHEGDDATAQGYFLAAMLREHLSCKFQRVDPEKLLKEWGASIQELTINGVNVDAIAVWGQNRSATILLNTAGPRAQHPKGTRSTLAHEICHILVDISEALPVAEVLGGRVPRTVERRANAFAAEFLLPRAVVVEQMKKDLKYVHTPNERRKVIETALTNLAETYGASHETTAWQMLNSGSVDADYESVLRKYFKSIYEPFEVLAA